jgi:hypothetical protein
MKLRYQIAAAAMLVCVLTVVALGRDYPYRAKISAETQSDDTQVTLTLDNGESWNYIFSDGSNEDLKRYDAAVRSWQVGETIEVSIPDTCYMSYQLTDLDKQAPYRDACFLGPS